MPEEVVKVEHKPKEKKKSAKVKSIIEWIVSGIFIAAAATLIGFRIHSSKTNKPMFGVQYPVVLTDSMEPDYKVKDVLVVKKVDPSEIKVGDDITFYWDLTNKGDIYPMTHRVLSIDYYPDASENSGYHYTIVTHGINTKSNQCGKPEGCDITWQKQVFHEDVLIGKVTRKSLFMKAITSVWGLILLILFPTIYIMATTVIDMFRKLEEDEEVTEINSDGSISPNGNPLAGLSKGEIEQLKKEMMEEILNKGKK